MPDAGTFGVTVPPAFQTSLPARSALTLLSDPMIMRFDTRLDPPPEWRCATAISHSGAEGFAAASPSSRYHRFGGMLL